MIRQNAHKYSVSAMCKVLQVNRSTYYYETRPRPLGNSAEAAVVEIFVDNRRVYGTRKIKVELRKLGMVVSRRRIGKLMKKNGLVSSYTVAQYKVHHSPCNEDKVPNELNRQFQNKKPFEAVVSDLTYVRVAGKWNYICLLIDLFNREIIGHSCGPAKDANLVYRAFAKVKGNLNDIQLFHTDRGREFKNKLIDEVIKTFQIKRSLSMKGCPYDNAVSEATYKLVKSEFIRNRCFYSLEQLKRELNDYVRWFNEKRIHSTLGYLTPYQYKSLNKIV